MTPTKLLIAQRLFEAAAELAAIAEMAAKFSGPEHYNFRCDQAAWKAHTDELHSAIDLMRYWSADIRGSEL